jgi:hypothetical protein
MQPTLMRRKHRAENAPGSAEHLPFYNSGAESSNYRRTADFNLAKNSASLVLQQLCVVVQKIARVR